MSAQTQTVAETQARQPIVINQISPSVIGEVLSSGWTDFKTAPWFGLFFGLVYALGGWAVVLLAAASGYYFLAYPLAAGFALIAPFVAAGLLLRQSVAGTRAPAGLERCVLLDMRRR